MTDPQGQKFGVVGLIGMPNAGKSTLLNSLLGEKLAIVSHKVQTTRFAIRGIAMHEQTQMVFVDTPGILRPKRNLDRAMLANIHQSLMACDAVLIMVDGSHPDAYEHAEKALQMAQNNHKENLYLVLNKIDKFDKKNLLPMTLEMARLHRWKATFMVSALSGSGVKDIISDLAKEMPDGPWAYDSETLTDLPLRLMASELIREQVYASIHDEIPYALTVECEEWKEDKTRIQCKHVIYIERDSQKGVILGKGGQMIKRLGQTARLELEERLGKTVRLEIFVKVRKDWQQDVERYQALGLSFPGA